MAFNELGIYTVKQNKRYSNFQYICKFGKYVEEIEQSQRRKQTTSLEKRNHNQKKLRTFKEET